jgi:hypothetical protein
VQTSRGLNVIRHGRRCDLEATTPAVPWPQGGARGHAAYPMGLVRDFLGPPTMAGTQKILAS